MEHAFFPIDSVIEILRVFSLGTVHDRIDISKMEKKHHKKPTGTMGVNHLGNNGPQTISDFEPAMLPGTKAQNEMIVVKSFLQSSAHIGIKSFAPIIPIQNIEADFDFTLHTSSGELVMELLELAPNDQMKGGYLGASAKHNIYDFCSSLMDQIMAKSKRYARPNGKRFDLLVYVTHWAFIPSQACIRLLQYWCVTKPHVFDDIYLHLYIGERSISFPLFTSPSVVDASFDPSSVKGKSFTNFNPLEWKTNQGDIPRVGSIDSKGSGMFMMASGIEEA